MHSPEDSGGKDTKSAAIDSVSAWDSVSHEDFLQEMMVLAENEKWSAAQRTEFTTAIQIATENPLLYESFKAVHTAYKEFEGTIVQEDLAFNALKLAAILGSSATVNRFLAKTQKSPQMQEISFQIPTVPYDTAFFHRLFAKKDLAPFIPELIPKMVSFEEAMRQHCRNAKINWKSAHTSINTPEVVEFISKTKYLDASQDLAAAALFYEHDMSTEQFSSWMRAKARAQSSDNLIAPSAVFVDGASVGHPNLYLIKMKDTDPRQAYLGEITNCCQTIGVSPHVEEDTRLSEVGMVILARDGKRKDTTRPLPSTDYLSETCKDDDILGFMRVCVSKDHKHLIIDATVLKATQKANAKKHAQLVAKFAAEFIAKTPMCDSVWCGKSFETAAFANYFLNGPPVFDIMPTEMQHSEAGCIHLICDSSHQLYAEIIYNPAIVKQLTTEQLSTYNKAILLHSLIQFGSLEEIEHFISLMTDALLSEIDLLSIAYNEQDLEKFSFLLGLQEGRFIQPMLVDTIFTTAGLDAQHMFYFDKLFDIVGEEEIVRMITTPTKWDTPTIVHIISQQALGHILSKISNPELKHALIATAFITADPERAATLRLLQTGDFATLDTILASLTPAEVHALFTQSIPSGFLLDRRIGKTPLPYLLHSPSISTDTKRAILLERMQIMIGDKCYQSFNSLMPRDMEQLRCVLETEYLTDAEKTDLLKAMRVFEGKETSIIHALVHYSHPLNLPKLEYLCALDNKKFPIEDLFFSKDSDGLLAVEVAIRAKNLTETTILLEKMCQNPNLFKEFIQSEGKRIALSLQDTKTLPLWIDMVQLASAKHGFVISKELYTPPLQAKPTAPRQERRTFGSLIGSAANNMYALFSKTAPPTDNSKGAPAPKKDNKGPER